MPVALLVCPLMDIMNKNRFEPFVCLWVFFVLQGIIKQHFWSVYTAPLHCIRVVI